MRRGRRNSLQRFAGIRALASRARAVNVAVMVTRKTRLELDTLGEVEVDAAALWGAQTQRSLVNFAISQERMPRELILALAQVKEAAAEVNAELGQLDEPIAKAIAAAAREVLDGQHADQFPLVVWQTGSGTQTNMNMNEVLANRASELLGGERGLQRLVHPNDHVNRSQSSNDVFPTATAVASVASLSREVIPAVETLREVLEQKADRFYEIIKIGRTHLMDATPLRLGQEIGGWASQLRHGLEAAQQALPRLGELAIGGTAVGSGINAPAEFGARVAARLAQRTGLPLTSAPNKFEVISAHDAWLSAHGALKTLAASLTKIANDVRWLSSGPRCGLGELTIPANEPGSSIMPGKVNPTQAEALIMACYQVMANDVVINLAGLSGNFQLNVCKPLIAHAFLQSCRLLAGACRSFSVHCASGLEPDRQRIADHLERSLMLVTALAPHIGYDRAAEIAKHAHRQGMTLREAALELNAVSPQDFDRWVNPSSMVSG